LPNFSINWASSLATSAGSEIQRHGKKQAQGDEEFSLRLPRNFAALFSRSVAMVSRDRKTQHENGDEEQVKG